MTVIFISGSSLENFFKPMKELQTPWQVQQWMFLHWNIVAICRVELGSLV